MLETHWHIIQEEGPLLKTRTMIHTFQSVLCHSVEHGGTVPVMIPTLMVCFFVAVIHLMQMELCGSIGEETSMIC